MNPPTPLKLPALRRLFPFALVVSLLLGCNFVQTVKREIENAGKPQVLTSADGRYQITVPGTWRRDPELNAEAALAASNRAAEMYVVVISESKEDFADDVTLDTFTEVTRQHMMSKVADADANPPASVTVSGYPARQYTLRGTVEKFKAAYLITLVQTPGGFHQIIAWTLNSRYDKNFGTLLEVTDSFKETGAPPPPPAPAASPNDDDEGDDAPPPPKPRSQRP